jgi:phosphoribosylformimino-5-aminoimidazole carboxamide ribotide isomerase
VDIYPAIDLLNGRGVRLHQGRYDSVTVYVDDPPAFAATLRGIAQRLHVVDLEGARTGRPVQRDVVRAIVAAFGSGVQIGGGVRTIEAAEEYLGLGAERVVLGTAAVRDPELVRTIAAKFPERVVVALDAKDGLVATDGWETVSTRTSRDVAESFAGVPLAAILYTDVSRDGTEVGPNIDATAALAQGGWFPVIASGGVGTLEHLTKLAAHPGIEGAIVGRALYERRFTLEEAIQATRS